MQKAKFDKFYLVKIELAGIRPPIWRRVIVPKNIGLSHFDTLVQLIMGWSGYHLSAFEIGDKWYKKRLPDDVDFWDKNMDVDCAKYVLSDILNKERPRINHYYDFSDDWRHKITLEDDDYTLPADANSYVLCIKGKRACPPEDIGGAWAYNEILSTLKDKNSDKMKELKKIHDKELIDFFAEFDSEKFDIDSINEAIAEYLQDPDGYFDKFEFD